MSKRTGRRNFIKHSLAAAGAACVASARPDLLNPSDTREGLNLSNLERLKDQLAARQTTGLLDRRHNRTVYEWYAAGWGPEKPHYAASIVRKALGSDVWPLAWGDDDAQYTAYGDGWGFEPRTEQKLSLGFARVAGRAEDFEGTNIRSPSGERMGDGPAGAKAGGLLMVDGTLYMWARNCGNAQLAWSDDRAATWHWEFRLEESFGSPAFLQFGSNYEGARDRFVYVYSQDGPSAYEAADSLVLARVAKDRIRRREAYEFFSHVDSAGVPVWTSDIRRRGKVFSFPGHCQRVGAVYNPFCRRYLLSFGFDQSGGWGIFDAPEPWGPWSTAFFTRGWGIGPTHN